MCLSAACPHAASLVTSCLAQPARDPAGAFLTLFRPMERDNLCAHDDVNGSFKFNLDLLARVSPDESWKQVSFVGPVAGIGSISAEAAGGGVELQLLSGTPLASREWASPGQSPASTGKVPVAPLARIRGI